MSELTVGLLRFITLVEGRLLILIQEYFNDGQKVLHII